MVCPDGVSAAMVAPEGLDSVALADSAAAKFGMMTSVFTTTLPLLTLSFTAPATTSNSVAMRC